MAGLLFLLQMIAASLSHSALLQPILRSGELLPAISAHVNTVRAAMLIDLVCGLSVFGIAVLLFPVLKKYSESIALWYLGLRLNEWVCLTISGVLLLTLVSISTDYAGGARSDQSSLPALAKYLLAARNNTKVLMLLSFCFSAAPFYYLLWRSKLVPAFVPIWGLIGVVLLFAEVITNIYGTSLGGIKLMLPMGLNELFLGVWMMTKGFRERLSSY